MNDHTRWGFELRTAPIVTSFSITVVMKRKKRKLRTFTAEIGEELLFGISRALLNTQSAASLASVTNASAENKREKFIWNEEISMSIQ
ncbi:hypothetical protein SCA6_013149 [Theobroma cacao]